MIQNDLAVEMTARTLYADAAGHCLTVNDLVTRDLFAELMQNEERHIDYLKPSST